jgi:inosine-uridine nucleoside N-ribohydrolase
MQKRAGARVEASDDLGRNRTMTLARACAAALIGFLLPAALEAGWIRGPAHARIPVILDTDIGGDIDDTWALVLLLKSPDLDLRLVTTDFGNTVYRAKIVARLLQSAGRTDIPIGIGIKGGDEEGGQAEWVRGYDLASYPGRILPDGVQAIVDAAMAAKEPTTLIAIGPCPNLKRAIEREPRIATRLRLAGMFGSLRRGYGGARAPEPEWNVRADPEAAHVLLAAPWIDAILTPLDTCGVVQLKGDRFARVRDSRDPLLRVLMENYRLWCAHQKSCASDPEFVATKSTTLFDTVAIYLALSRDLVITEQLGVRVTGEGMTVPDGQARRLGWATGWKSLDRFEDLLVERLAGNTAAP